MVAKFTIEDIKSDKKMRQFLKLKTGRAENTITNYLFVIKNFCNFTEMTPTEIYKAHRNDLLDRTPEFDMWLNEKLDEYVSYLVDSDFKHGTIKHHVARIKGFFHAFKLKPTPDPIIPIKHVREDAKYALKVEDIRKAIQNSTPTYQAYFITQAQTGLSLSDVLLLDVGDFVHAVSHKGEDLTVKEAIYRAKNENMIGCFDLRRKKTSVEFYTFVGPEALQYIATLLENRDEKFLKPESPIFMKDTSRLQKSKVSCQKDLRLSPNAVKCYVDRLHWKKNIFPRIVVDGKEKNYFRTHKLRKWYSNQLRFKAGFGTDDTKYLMGQKTGDIIEEYIDPNNYNALKGNYRKALPHLAITQEVVMEENKEAIEKLEQDNKRLQEQIQKREEQHKKEMEEMKARLDNVEKDSFSYSDVRTMVTKVSEHPKSEELNLLLKGILNKKRTPK